MKHIHEDLFNKTWLTQKLSGESYLSQDVARTLVELSAQSIYNALLKDCSEVSNAYLCGGGARNILLKKRLQSLLTHTTVETTDALGIGVDWVEAIAFSWLAKQCLNQKTANLPLVTGAKGSRILGAIYQH